MSCPTYQPVGDSAVLVSYENRICTETNEKVRLLADNVETISPHWLQDVLFSYRCVMVIYEPRMIRYSQVVEFINRIEGKLPLPSRPLPDLYEIPTVYGGHNGPDLERVAEVTGYSPEEVVNRFSSTVFRVYFLGFLCAQPYLGRVPQDLQVPRQDTARLRMPAGSVGIGGAQASLITINQPSGHNFIGRSFLCLYDPREIPPPCLKAGDQVRFPSIREDQIRDVRGQIPIRRVRSTVDG